MCIKHTLEKWTQSHHFEFHKYSIRNILLHKNYFKMMFSLLAALNSKVFIKPLPTTFRTLLFSSLYFAITGLGISTFMTVRLIFQIQHNANDMGLKYLFD